MYNLDAINGSPVGAVLFALSYALCFGFYLMLAFVQDIGKLKSFLMIGFIFLFHLIALMFSMILRPGKMLGDGTSFDSMRIFRHTTMVVLAINVCICIYFKYRDKSARGSK
jgi:hypothetical protein